MRVSACLKKESWAFLENRAAKKTNKTLDLTGWFCGYHSRQRFSGDENRLLPNRPHRRSMAPAPPLPPRRQKTRTATHWHPYAKIFCGENHVQGKAHTFTIESLNNRIRCYLARLKRRTHNYSKSRENLAASILFFIVNKCGGELASETQSIPI
jgi:insertion element IS1 protein InsB